MKSNFFSFERKSLIGAINMVGLLVILLISPTISHYVARFYGGVLNWIFGTSHVFFNSQIYLSIFLLCLIGFWILSTNILNPVSFKTRVKKFIKNKIRLFIFVVIYIVVIGNILNSFGKFVLVKDEKILISKYFLIKDVSFNEVAGITANIRYENIRVRGSDKECKFKGFDMILKDGNKIKEIELNSINTNKVFDGVVLVKRPDIRLSYNTDPKCPR